jgi:hypothetical protein
MIGMFGIVRSAWGVFVFLCVAYVVMFVKLGERTLFEHAVRIARTDEAKDLGREATEASQRLRGDLADQVRHAAVENER